MIRNEFNSVKHLIPFIYNFEDSLKVFLSSNKTFIKFGDGEFDLILSNFLNTETSFSGLKFQSYNDILTKKLHEILTSDSKDIEICIGRSTFYKSLYENDSYSAWNFYYGCNFLKKLLKLPSEISFFNFNRKYLDMGIFIPNHAYNKSKVNIKTIFDIISQTFKNKNILIVTGDKSLSEYNDNENILRLADSVSYYWTPIRNSFDIYETCLNDLKNEKNKLLIMATGPLGKILSYDLQTLYGIRCLCLGHFMRDYKNFLENIEPFSKEDSKFFID